MQKSFRVEENPNIRCGLREEKGWKKKFFWWVPQKKNPCNCEISLHWPSLIRKWPNDKNNIMLFFRLSIFAYIHEFFGEEKNWINSKRSEILCLTFFLFKVFACREQLKCRNAGRIYFSARQISWIYSERSITCESGGFFVFAFHKLFNSRFFLVFIMIKKVENLRKSLI